MLPPVNTLDEAERLHALQALDLLDTPAEERFDRLTRIARHLFGVKIALVSLVDSERQWFKSSAGGLAACETPRTISFCGHAVLDSRVMLVPDALADERFRDNPLVTGEPFIRFYAGRPLRVLGRLIGTLCLIDSAPRTMSAQELGLFDDLAAMVEDECLVTYLATTDELTKVANRRGFELVATKTLQMCRRMDKPATLLLFDLDRFKSINDVYGHAAGDAALRDFSEALSEAFRDSDIVGRLGGDEFVVLLADTMEGHDLHAIDRLDEKLQALNARDVPYRIHYSVGQARFEPSMPPNVSELLNAADKVMYRHKRR